LRVLKERCPPCCGKQCTADENVSRAGGDFEGKEVLIYKKEGG
jgi:hypothetical protein